MGSYSDTIAVFKRISHRSRVRLVRWTRRRHPAGGDLAAAMHLMGVVISYDRAPGPNRAKDGYDDIAVGIPIPPEKDLWYRLNVNWQTYPSMPHAEEFVNRVWGRHQPTSTLSEAERVVARGFAALPPEIRMAYLSGYPRSHSVYDNTVQEK